MTDRTITLAEPDGTTLDVVLLSAGSRAGLPSATFELDFGAWDRVESNGLLHADPARSRSGSRPFDPGKSVQIEAVLDPVAAIDGVDALADRLVSARPGDPLLSTEAWWSLSATQEVDLPGELARSGSLHEGISYEHPVWLRDAAGSVGLEEAWQRAMELQDRIDTESPLLDLVVDLFEEQEWEIDRPTEEATVVHAGVASDAGDFDLYVRTDEHRHSRLWHVTLSVSGPRTPLPEVRRCLEQLAHDHPFLLTSRYATDHAEIRYWEEARDLHDAAAMALRLWGEHRSSAGLPPWETVGLEVIDRATYHQRLAEGYGPPPAVPVGVHPF